MVLLLPSRKRLHGDLALSILTQKPITNGHGTASVAPVLPRESWIAVAIGASKHRSVEARSEHARGQPQVALPLANVMVMWPIVVSAFAPCQWRSPAFT